MAHSLVTLRRTDRYRGLAFLVFRFFAMRRELARLKQWAETGSFVRGGLFERPHHAGRLCRRCRR